MMTHPLEPVLHASETLPSVLFVHIIQRSNNDTITDIFRDHTVC